MKKGKGKKGKGSGGSVGKSSLKGGSGSGVRVNYKVVSIVVVVLLLLFLVFVFNRGGDSEDGGLGSLFSFMESFRIDPDPFPGPEIDIDPDPEIQLDCPRDGDDNDLTTTCYGTLHTEHQGEFICCGSDQECDTNDEGEPLCSDEAPEEELCPPDGNPDLTTTCYGQEGTASENKVACCAEDQECATNEDGEATCVDPFSEGEIDDLCMNSQVGPVLCVMDVEKEDGSVIRYRVCCPENEPSCYFDEERGAQCTSGTHLCNGLPRLEGQICCGEGGEEWVCAEGTTCGPPGTQTCPPIGLHMCLDTDDPYACSDGNECCDGVCCDSEHTCMLTEQSEIGDVYGCVPIDDEHLTNEEAEADV